jgi:hypothetical protein
MRHLPSPADKSAVVQHSPLQVLDAAFAALSKSPTPVGLPAALLGLEQQDEVSLDQVRRVLARRSTSVVLRARVWSVVLGRAREDGEPWTTVVVGLLVPGLWRLVGRMPHPVGVDEAEVQQEMLAAVLGELREVPADEEWPAQRLLRAADRAGHRVVYAAAKECRRTVSLEAQLVSDRPASRVAGEVEGDEFQVLGRAVVAGVLTAEEAVLIARTRLEGAAVTTVAAELGGACPVAWRQLYRRRYDAEARLVAAIRRGALRSAAVPGRQD